MSEQLTIVSELTPTTADVIAGYRNSQAESFAVFTAFDVSGDHPDLQAASRERTEQKTAFLSDAIHVPVLNNCPNFNLMRGLRRKAYGVVRSLLAVQDLRYQNGARATYEDSVLDTMIARSTNEIGYVETAALIANGSLGSGPRREVAALLKAAGRGLYAMPDPATTAALLHEKRAAAHMIRRDRVHPAKDDAEYVLERLQFSTDMPSAEAFPRLDPQTVEHYYNILQEECGEAVSYAFEPIGRKEIYSPGEMKTVCQRYLEHRGYTASGWKAEIVANRTMCATNRKNKSLEVGDLRPAELRAYKPLVRSLIHEGEIHIGRAHRWDQAATVLAGLSLPGSAQFEEAFAGTVQNLYFREHRRQGEQYGTALGISAGYDGIERDFRDSFELMWRLELLQKYDKNTAHRKQVEAQRARAYGHLARIWRGMPTDIPGCVFPKDAQYDNTLVAEYLAHGGRPLPRPEFLRLLDAKYTPFDAEQAALVRSLSTRSDLGRIAASERVIH